jgi:PAS domain S-box-containing protein
MESSSEKNFRDFFEKNIDFLFILDMDGNIMEINNAVHEILGYSDTDLIGKNVLMVHPPEFREEAGNTVRQMLMGKKSFCPIPLLTKANEYIPVETRVFPGLWDSKQALIGVSKNLSELKLSEEKFSSILDNSPLLMALSTVRSGIFIDVNQRFLDTFGYTKDEILGTASKDLDLFDDYQQRDKALEIFSKEGHLKDFEVIAKKKSGELLNCLFSLHKIKIQTYEYLLTSAMDITQLKRAESKLGYMFKQQKLLADISQLLNSTMGLRKILNDVLRFIGEHTGVSRVYIFEDKSTGNSTTNTFEWCNIGIAPQIQDLQDVYYDAFPSWKDILVNTGRVFSTNIQELPEDIKPQLEAQGIKSILVYPLHVQGAFYGFIGFDECVSSKDWPTEEIDLLRTVSNIISNAFERERVLEKLESSELRLNLALSSAKEGLWDWNIKTGHLYFSEVWCNMLGYVPDEIEPHVSSWENRVHPEDRFAVMEILNKHLNRETAYYEAVYRAKTKDGNWKWVLDHGMVVQWDGNGLPLRAIGTNIDITKQKEIEEQLKESIESKNKLFSIIGHDLRGPIGSSLQMLELLTSDEELTQDEKNTFLEEFKKANKTVFNLLENLLNWSRSQTNSILLKPTQFSINKLINDNVEFLASSAKQKALNVIVKSGQEHSVFADEDTIAVVFRNLLSNAIKFTPNNGEIIISIIDKGQQIEVEIADNGVGMKKEFTENLFKSKNFSSSRGTNKEKGSGLGLVLCKDFIEKNGGQIRVESFLGKGSKFFITIPKNK